MKTWCSSIVWMMVLGTAATSAAGEPRGGRGGEGPALVGHANLNTAPPEVLEMLPGCGPVCASRIIAARTRAPFKAAVGLRRVKGIGPVRFRAMRPFVTIEGPNDLRRPAETAALDAPVAP